MSPSRSFLQLLALASLASLGLAAEQTIKSIITGYGMLCSSRPIITWSLIELRLLHLQAMRPAATHFTRVHKEASIRRLIVTRAIALPILLRIPLGH